MLVRLEMVTPWSRGEAGLTKSLNLTSSDGIRITCVSTLSRGLVIYLMNDEKEKTFELVKAVG